ncbi:hypothetical protein AOA59_22425 [Pseudomonas sp. 2822-15]|nr:hypothetical protein AOA59_22425 [Pseudomonas sp. 2822-15]
MLMDAGSPRNMLWDLVENHAEAGRLSIEQCCLFRNWSFMAHLTASIVRFGEGLGTWGVFKD